MNLPFGWHRKFVNKDDNWTVFPRHNIFELRGRDDEFGRDISHDEFDPLLRCVKIDGTESTTRM
jgi:hypothetical protein